jgi:protein phosphatase
LETLASGTPQGCADRLIELALRGGGPDNVTCIVADVVDPSEGDDLPIVGGAVTDRVDTMDSGSSPAARAARMSSPDRVEPPAAQPRRGKRRWLVSGMAALLLVAAAVSGYLWTQKQYFVGRDGNEVAVFRGVNTHFGPVSLYSVIQNSDLKVDDLTQAAGGQVINGITANSRADAQAILKRLAAELKPPCPVATPVPTASASRAPTATRAPSASRAPSVSRTLTASRVPSASRTLTRALTKPPAPSRVMTTPTASGTLPATPSPSTAPVQGVDCR